MGLFHCLIISSRDMSTKHVQYLSIYCWEPKILIIDRKLPIGYFSQFVKESFIIIKLWNQNKQGWLFGRMLGLMVPEILVQTLLGLKILYYKWYMVCGIHMATVYIDRVPYILISHATCSFYCKKRKNIFRVYWVSKQTVEICS